MVRVKNTESKKTTAKRIITISNIRIDNGKFYDEDGDISLRLLEALPDHDMEFTMKITIDLEDCDEETEDE